MSSITRKRYGGGVARIVAALVIFAVSQAIPIIAGPPWQGSPGSLALSAVAGGIAGFLIMRGVQQIRRERRTVRISLAADTSAYERELARAMADLRRIGRDR